MKKRIGFTGVVIAIILTGLIAVSSCKSCNNKEAVASNVDTTAAQAAPPSLLAGPNLPHADSTLAPVLEKVLDEVFAASKSKDYSKVASYIVYRGPDEKRMGYGVFTTKNAYERNVVRITAEEFNKWNSNCETRDYARLFSLAQPDGREMTVLEVIFVSKKGVNRKFFGFLSFGKEGYKIVDVTSNLDMPQ